jgi:predicted ATPase
MVHSHAQRHVATSVPCWTILRASHFKHAAIQEAASQPVLQRTRQRHMAQVLAAPCPNTGATQPELLTHHYTEAGYREQAVRY